MASAEQYEIEIKSLLGDAAAAESFRVSLKSAFPECALTATESQLNHYFDGGDIAALTERIASRLSSEDREKLARIAERAVSVSVRTRQVGEEVRFVVKASLGDDTSANGIVRAELDVPMQGMTLAELDEEIRAAGYEYQAKWSRDRESYEIPGASICIDRNAGYGYLVEFEKVVDDPQQIEAAKAELVMLMDRLGAEELQQDRLERMFAHYNTHWPEYYGTDKVFVIT
jgi:adenylate cyclase class IV